MIFKTFNVAYTTVGEPMLPDFAGIAGLAFEAEGKSAFDELHGFFNGHAVGNGEE